MRIEHPAPEHIPGLRLLWRQAFGDPDAYLDLFFSRAYDPGRCLCALEDGKVAAAMYWLDCHGAHGKLAYLYAVATDRAYRGRGLCRRLTEQANRLLEKAGYAGSVLVPGEPGLFAMYEAMGYRVCSRISEWEATAGEVPEELNAVSLAQYATLRRKMLPPGAVVQEGPALALLEAQGEFYAGKDLLLCAIREGDSLWVPELLGDATKAPGIVAALGAARGRFRGPGEDRDFAMYRPAAEARAPSYLGFALD